MSTRHHIPPLPWLRAFEASARHLSFTHAANELGLSQTAVSKQVKNLEQHLRESLFERRPRSLILTKAGATYIPKVRDAFDRLAAGTEEVFGHRRSELLTIRVSVGFSAYCLGPRLKHFREANPNIDFRIISVVWNDETDVQDADLEIRYGSGDWPQFVAERLTSEELIPLCHPDLVSGNPPLNSLADIRHHTLLHVNGYEDGWASWLKTAGADQAGVGQGIQFDTSILAFEMAATGCGIALGRSSLAAQALSEGRLIEPFDIRVPINEGFFILSPIDKVIHPDAKLFRSWIMDLFNPDNIESTLPG
ncbi:MAG: LysR family transcriptional regulator [Rhodospirillaceae bacterium]|nr:LysR family transcriptional regulator [Rhodospirillaceae bacterium]MBL6931323.1 LysR family transcriptional regulator [Rhodospirillales bacterium]